ncbi:GNAT family N-acetyltransferase [Peribacillus frigoritolerans]|uniref:GNAT family N-acetyltransferase n=1 Tax=Peribacillus frigoritolerans TaxID=450367 RepID=UPI0006BFEBA9|nr:GNAT family N-acetyltransferase [Peribacillus frigoritolerans]AZV63945.1 GNAT family N-acetyltransferase [Peribacillus frigoritolerans]KOR87230.1 acetyltransferase [Bacillus sp. FJAT-22058]MED4688574.1 GNAT family N-acetyltransferase [Peribacillus frigoritolerans]
MEIRELFLDEPPPMNLLLLADPSRKLVEEYLGSGTCFVAVRDNRVIGVCVLLQKGPELIEIMNIAVDEQYHGRGIGRQLIEHVIGHAREQGYKMIEIGTGNSGIGQLALYQKCGFRITGVDRDFFNRNYSEAIYENGIQCQDMIRLSQSLD